MNPILRRGAAVVLAALPFACLVATAVTLRPRLGPTIASHWSGSGGPDGFSATWPMFGVLAAVSGAGMLVASVVVLARAQVARSVALIAELIGGASAAAWVVCASATAATPTPRTAEPGAALALFLVPVVLGIGISVLIPPASRSLANARTPNTALAEGERIAYGGVIGSRPLGVAVVVVCLLAVGTIAAAVATGEPGLVGPAVALLIAGSSILLLVPVRLSVDARGIRLTSVLLGVPLIRVPLAAIEQVTAEHIEPGSWGGWGYRFSASGRAYVARRGPGIVIRRRNGSAIAITVDDPDIPASVANALVARAGASR